MATKKSDETAPREDAPAGDDPTAEPGEVAGDDATKGEGVGEALGPDVDKSFPTVSFDDPPAPEA